MLVPISWLKDYLDINIKTKELADALTLSGSKVEKIINPGENISNVVAGKIISMEKHPNADKLKVAKVLIGKGESIQVVTNATNVKEGDIIPVALVGAKLAGGLKIKKGKIRGVESFGMMCSIKEFNLTEEDYPDAPENGVYIFSDDTEISKDAKDIFGLNDETIEFEITSNRPDCLSIEGIGREAAATLRTEYKQKSFDVKEVDDLAKNYIDIEIKDYNLCPRYAARIVKNVKIKPSPEWLKRRLKSAGVRPINNIVDITNYVMLELGQPMHAFDLEFLKEKKIVVRKANENEKMNTLDDSERTLDTSMLVIADGKRPVAVAGVMGGANSEIQDSTKTILFESANFDGLSVRMTSKKLGLRTESSARFEKGLDPENVVRALDMAASLINLLEAGDVLSGVIDLYDKVNRKRKINFNPVKINRYLGTSIEELEMIKILERIDIKVNREEMTLEVPTFRADIEREADIIEEIARFYDYNNIKPSLLSGKEMTLGKKSYKQEIEDLISNLLISNGLSEIYTYSFTGKKVFDKINLSKDNKLRNTVNISNPIGEDYSIMRTSAFPEMLEVLSRNYSHSIEKAEFFEFAKVYYPLEDATKLPDERTVLTLGMYGNYDFYDLKGVVEIILERLRIKDYNFNRNDKNTTFHPGRTADIVIDKKVIGVIGEVHPIVTENFELPERVYMCSINLEALIDNSSKKIEYDELPKYPAVTRDLSLISKEDIMVKDIEKVISKNSNNLLEDIRLFDVYHGEQIGKGLKSISYSLIFRDKEKTLEDNTINSIIDKILKKLKSELNIELRK